MQELQYTFTTEELTELGFETVTEDDSTYMEYIFDKSDYWESKFLATTDILSIEWVLRSVKDWKVLSPLGDEAEPYLEKQQLIDILNRGDF